MKVFKIIGLSLMTFTLAGTVTAQRDAVSTITPSSQQEYFTDVKTLVTYFSNGAIPEDFPKLDPALSEDDNIKAVVTWTDVSSNFALLSDAGKAKLNEYKTKPAPTVRGKGQMKK